MDELTRLGWDAFFEEQLTRDERRSGVVGRAVADRGRRLAAHFGDGEERLVVVPTKLRAQGQPEPVVGDWLVAREAEEPVVTRVLERRARLSRNVAGRTTGEQVLAANVDVAFVIQGLDTVPNLRRLERTAAAVFAGGAEPVVVLTKADLSEEAPAELAETSATLPGIRVMLASTRTGQGLDEMQALLASGRTAVFTGPSGAGKSSLVNAMLGAGLQETQEVRDWDRRGRHTTTGRRLFTLPGGGAVIDGPGIRELRLWGAGLGETFADVQEIAARCRFSDCRHLDEPGCAVRAAVEAGELDPERLESLHKLDRELRAQQARLGGAAARVERQHSRAIHRELRRFQKDRGR